MKIRITKTPLRKAQYGLNDPDTLTINGITYRKGTPEYEVAMIQKGTMIDEGYRTMRAMQQEADQMLGRTQPVFDLKQAPNQFTPTGDKTSPYTWATNLATPTGQVQSLQQTVKANATKAAVPSAFMNFNSPFGTLATEDKATGIISNPLGRVSMMDTQALGYNNDGTKATPEFTSVNLGDLGRTIKSYTDPLKTGIMVGSLAANYITNKKSQKAAKSYMQQQQMTDNLFTPQQTDRGDYVQTGMTTGMLRPDEYTVNKEMFAADGGTINNPTMKIRITGAPKQMAYGGQFKPAGSLDIGGQNVYTQMPAGPNDTVSNTMPVADPSTANIEAELGEVLYGDVDNDGVKENMNIPGKPHSKGGTLLDAPSGSFIFSKKLKEKNPEILKEFNRSFKKGGVSYADIAKQYPINKYKAIIDDPNTDALAKSTAQLMVKNYEAKLGKLAFAQEAGKGFPDGPPNSVMTDNMPVAAAGGFFKAAEGIDWNAITGVTAYTPAPIDPYAGNKDKQKTPTNKENSFNLGPEYVKDWEAVIPGISKMKNKNAQDAIYDYMLQNNPDEIRNMWKTYGLTKEGKKNKNLVALTDKDASGKPLYTFNNSELSTDQLKQLKSAYGDGFFGRRTMRYTKPTADPVQQYACTPNGVVAVKPGSAAAIPGGINGIYDTYEAAVAACTAKSVEQKKPNPYVTEAGQMGTEQGVNVPFDYMSPDKFNFMAAVTTGPKRYNPYIAPTKLTKPEPTFYDPARELAANAEMYNQTVAGAANFGNPQAYMANASKASGDALANAANIMGRYNNMNIGVANQFAPMRAEIDNKQALMDADRATTMRQLYATSAQNFDNAYRDYLDRIGKANAKMFDNRMNLDLINQTIPQYYTDPTTGRTFFKKGFGTNSFSNANNAGGLPQSDAEWAQLQADYNRHAAATGMTFAQYLNFRRTGRTTLTDKDNDGIPESSRRTIAR